MEKAEVNCSSGAWRKGDEEESSKGLGEINISYLKTLFMLTLC